ncbi:MAG TPA: diacylglycerol kinase family protein [Planctomycetota bacterium]|nr:diacylglycerol kinase family protein [Planctomycetota bacterium]
MPDFLVIANPTSGSRAAPAMATRAAELLRQKGHSAELKVTGARGDAKRWAADAAAAGVRHVVACGGDGTLQEVAAALEGSTTILGILPGGRCNDFAHALGISKKDSIEKLVGILTSGSPRAIDLGAMGDKRFLTVATLGFDSEVSRFVETRKLWVKGTLSYLYGIARVLPGFKFPRMILRGDFGTRDGPMLLAATGNTPCYGGAMHIAPSAKLDDGLFDICAVTKVSRATVLGILPKVLKGTHTTHPAVTMLQSRRVEIETPDGPQFICADGETLGQTPCVFEVRPGALRILAP